MKKRERRSQEQKQELQLPEQVLLAEKLVLPLSVEQPELRLPEELLALGEPQQVLLQLELLAQLILNLNR
jgi:hypothetical protein